MAFCFSRPASIRLWYGRITCAFSLTTSWLGSESSPRLRSRSISSSSASGSTTTPFPMMHFLPGCRIPLGTRCSTVFTPPTTSVCPALAPPWYRTTTSAQEVKRSTTFHFPSSPHCAPTITTLDMGIFLSRRRAATVRQRRRPGFAQLGEIGRRFQDALGRPAALTTQEDRDRAAGRHEFAAGHHGRRSPGDHRHFLRRVEEQPVLGSGLALPGADEPGDVCPGGGEGRWWRRPCIHGGRLGGGCLLLLLPSRAREQQDEGQRSRGFHNVTWCTLRTLGSLRNRS